MTITFQNDTTSGERQFDPIPANTLAEVEVVAVKYRPLNEEFRAKFNIEDTHEVSFDFRIIEGKHKNRRVFGATKPYLNNSDKCRLRIWLQELLGVDKLPETFSLNPNPDTGVFDEFTGMRCRVLTEQKTSASTGKVNDRVAQVLRSVADDDEVEPF